MKKLLLCVFCICISGIIQAVPYTLIDDFNDSILTEYTKSVTLEQDGIYAISFISPAGAIQATKSTGANAEQVLFLRDDYHLAVGQVLRVNAAVISSGSYADFGIVVSKELDPADAVWTSGTVDVRHDYLYMYVKAGSNGWGCLGFNGTTQVTGSGYVTGQDLTLVKGLYIKRIADTVFEVGYSTVSGDVLFRTLTVASLSGSYNAVGIYADLRAVITYGDLDNLRIESYPYDPYMTQVMNGSVINATFNWKAAPDTNATASGYVVHPDIVDQYVFIGSGTDPNLYYVGATGVDPGTSNPASQLTASIAYDTSYRWAVVEAMDGHAQTLTPGVSSLLNVDPNNIVGPTWTFNSLSSVPVISQQPAAEVRAFTTDPNVVFTCLFGSISPATVLWYKTGSATPLSTGGDIIISTTNDGLGNYTTRLQINTPAIADEGSYYCTINNGTPLLTSSSGILVIKQLLARYDFDGNLNPTAGSAADAPVGQAKDTQGDPNSLHSINTTLAPATGIDGVAGHAVQIDPNEYIDFGTSAYPKAGGLTGGIGRGLDEGSILCWIQPTNSSTVLANYNNGATTGFSLSLAANSGTADGRIDVRGEGAAGEYQVVGTVQGRPNRPGWNIFDTEWHLVTATWNAGGTLRMYVDGQQVNSVTAGSPTQYLPWQRGVLLGAGRNSTNRDLLTTLFVGAVDNLRIYNYEIDANAIAQEYLDVTGIQPCIDSAFAGSYYNTDNTGSSYCRVDLADFVDFAETWLTNGLFE